MSGKDGATEAGLIPRVLRNVGWAGGSLPVGIALGIVQAGLLARMLGPSGVGELALVMVATAFFAQVLRTTSAETLMTYLGRDLGAPGEAAGDIVAWAYLLDLATSFLSYAAVAFAAPWLAAGLGLPPEAAAWYRIYGIMVVLSASYWNSHALLRVTNRFHWTFWQNVGHSLLQTALIALLYVAGGSLVGVLWIYVAMAGVNATVLLAGGALALRERGIPIEARLPRVPPEVVRFSVLGHGRFIVKALNRYTDVLLLGVLVSTQQVGLYRAVSQVVDRLQAPGQAFLAGLYPEYSRLFGRGDMASLRHLVKRFAVGFTAVAALLFLASLFLARPAISLVLGEDFEPAAPILIILVAASAVTVGLTPLYPLPAAVGRAGPALKATTVALLTQVVLLVLLAPSMGSVGAGWARVGYAVAWALTLAPAIAAVLRSEGMPVEGRTAGAEVGG